MCRSANSEEVRSLVSTTPTKPPWVFTGDMVYAFGSVAHARGFNQKAAGTTIFDVSPSISRASFGTR
jgi:hypothetical protein